MLGQCRPFPDAPTPTPASHRPGSELGLDRLTGGVLLSARFLWALEVPPQGFPLGPLLLTLLLEREALGTEQGVCLGDCGLGLGGPGLLVVPQLRAADGPG